MLYTQTTESQKYLSAVQSLAPGTIRLLAGRYKLNRAVFLGLPIAAPNRPPGQVVQQVSLNLAEKLAALGASAGATITASGAFKSFIETYVAAAVTALGGFGSINPAGEWGFLFEDASQDNQGNWSYALPSTTFVYRTNGGASYTVSITVAQDGSATVAYTPVGTAPANAAPL